MTTRIGSALILFASLSASAHAAEIYSQAWDGAGNGNISVVDTAPAPDTWGEVARVYDDFTVSPSYSGASVDNVTWVGSYWDTSNFGPMNPTFSVQILSADGTETVLAEATGQANETLLGVNNYAYSIDLASALDLIAGQTYLVSIQAGYVMGVDWFETAWFWNTSNNGNDNSYAWNYFYADPNDWLEGSTRDFAFTLNGSVPEPSSLMLLGLASLLGFRNFKNRVNV